MPPRSVRAVSGASPRPNPRGVQQLRPRVVTRQKVFFGPVCDRPGCHEPPRPSLRNPAHYCGATCRQAVSQVVDRERKWLSRGTLDGRKKRAFEYAAALVNRRDECRGVATSRPPPKLRR
jgi:hypothetical protein